jgi:hypothetical protein
MIEVRFPDGSRRVLADDAARRLVERLCEIVQDARTASVAVAIQRDLRSVTRLRLPVEVPDVRAGCVTEALVRE